MTLRQQGDIWITNEEWVFFVLTTRVNFWKVPLTYILWSKVRYMLITQNQDFLVFSEKG